MSELVVLVLHIRVENASGSEKFRLSLTDDLAHIDAVAVSKPPKIDSIGI